MMHGEYKFSRKINVCTYNVPITTQNGYGSGAWPKNMDLVQLVKHFVRSGP